MIEPDNVVVFIILGEIKENVTIRYQLSSNVSYLFDKSWTNLRGVERLEINLIGRKKSEKYSDNLQNDKSC